MANANFSNATEPPFGASYIYKPDSIFAALYGLGIAVSLLSVLLTTTALYLLSRCSNAKRSYMYLLINLSITDLFIALAAIGMFGSDFFEDDIELGTYEDLPEYRRRNACARFLLGQIWDVATNENLSTMWLMAMDHFVAIRFPLKYPAIMRKRYILVIIALTWIMCSCFGMLPVLFVASSYDPLMDLWARKGTTRFCYQFVVYNRNEDFPHLFQSLHAQVQSGMAIGIVAIVLTSIISTYAYILVVVLRMKLHYSCAGNERTSGFSIAALSEKKKAIITTFVLISTFCLCYLPLWTYHISVEMAEDQQQRPYLNMSLTILASCVGIFDPVVYTARTPEIKAAMAKAMSACSLKQGKFDDNIGGLRRGTLSTQLDVQHWAT